MTLADLQSKYAEKRALVFDMFEHELIDNDQAKSLCDKLAEEFAFESDVYSTLDTLPMFAAAA